MPREHYPQPESGQERAAALQIALEKRYWRRAHPCSWRHDPDAAERFEYLWADGNWRKVWPKGADVPTFEDWPDVEIVYVPVLKSPERELRKYHLGKLLNPRNIIRLRFREATRWTRSFRRNGRRSKGWLSQASQRAVNVHRQALRALECAIEPVTPDWSLSLLLRAADADGDDPEAA